MNQAKDEKVIKVIDMFDKILWKVAKCLLEIFVLIFWFASRNSFKDYAKNYITFKCEQKTIEQFTMAK